METQSQFEQARRSHDRRIKAIRKGLGAGLASDKRAANISAGRVHHQVKAVSGSFNVATRKSHKGYYATPETAGKTLENKYTATALAILEHVSSNNIELDRWMHAQVELLRKMPQAITLYHCYGVNAHQRYVDWEKKQTTRFIHSEDRKNATRGLDWEITRAIVRGHRQAHSWLPALREVSPPSLSAALLYMFPHISAWYCVSHECFRQDVLESGFYKEKNLIAVWGKFKRSKRIQEQCAKALAAVIERYGRLAW